MLVIFCFLKSFGLVQLVLVVVVIGAINCFAQLHGNILVGVGNALNTQQCTTKGDFQECCILGACAHGSDFFLCFHHANPVGGFKKRVGRSRIKSELFGVQTLEGVLR